MKVPQLIDTTLERHGINRVTLGKLIGVSPSTITLWYGGARDPSLARYRKLDELSKAPKRDVKKAVEALPA